jgi:hypothetical protein
MVNAAACQRYFSATCALAQRVHSYIAFGRQEKKEKEKRKPP